MTGVLCWCLELRVIHGVSHSVRFHVYVSVPVRWVEYESSPLFAVPSPLVAAYCILAVTSRTAVERSILWHIKFSEFFVFMLFNFLACAHDSSSSSARYFVWLVLLVFNMLVLLATLVVSAISQTDFFTIVSRTCYDLRLSCMAFRSLH